VPTDEVANASDHQLDRGGCLVLELCLGVSGVVPCSLPGHDELPLGFIVDRRLLGLKRFRELVTAIEGIGDRHACRIDLSITTNGVLVSDEWALFFREHEVQSAVSIDGPAAVHDRWRPKLNGRGSHAEAVRGFRRLREAGLDPGIIAVCDPSSDPVETLRFFVENLDATHLDVLPPDLNHDDVVAPIGPYYVRMFDDWYDRYLDRGVRVRFLMSLIRSVLGLETNIDSFGFGPLHTVSLSTDGSLEPNDVLRIGGTDRTRSAMNVRLHTLDSARQAPSWQEAYESALRLNARCEACRYRNACGGGHLAHRWSRERRYDNPSVYCDDFIMMFDHVWKRVSKDIMVHSATAARPLADCASGTPELSSLRKSFFAR